ncbi:UV radiation resistance protein and autophagy-related subunit 14-domain-containing protein [Roridomyces roridus]|uniref:Autophagy-related protein 14 n=1 Tax=Roridomyces roridus TaxID=1738132 RepID=A0AAD7BH21_9AGAR|nr:UV radiation resistance protein and autophagy-related subunit 14-domain-containing protein [Roridomyces roridus]
MDCKICELKQRQFFCTNCLRAHTRDFRLKTQHFATERDEQVAKSTKALAGIEGPRIRRASVAQIQARVDEILAALGRLRKDNDKKRDRLRTLRESLAERRRTLSAAAAIAPSTSATTSTPHPTLAAPLAALSNLSALIARARAGLVQELIDVFNVVEVGGRPPLGGKAGSQGEWTIGDLILPVPGDVRRYPPQHINAVLGHAVHFVGLLSWYLGVKLPFTVLWEGGKLGVGVPWIGPGLGGWGRWAGSHPLHLSLSASPIPASPTNPSTPIDLALSQSLSGSLFTAANDSHLPRDPKLEPPLPSEAPQFTTALAMLLYNVLYLAHTQGIAIPLAQAGDVLSNLWAVCCSAELGRRSHATSSYPLLPLPTPSPSLSSGGFPIDFAHVLQAAASGGGRRAALARHVSGNVVSESRGEGEAKGKIKDKSKDKGRKEGGGGGKTEEEDGWDVVSEDGY